MKSVTIFSILLSILIISCERPPEYPDAPSIEYKSLSVDSLGNDHSEFTIQILFKDGTGDLGLTQTDTSNVKYQNINKTFKENGIEYVTFNRFSKNYWLDFFVKKNGKYVRMTTPDSSKLLKNQSSSFYINDGAFVPFTENYKDDKTPIEGLLKYQFSFDYTYDSINTAYRPIIEPGDSVQFRVRILDRKLNISNAIYTDKIVLFRK